MNLWKKAAMLAVVSLAFTTAQAAPTSISSGDVSASINDAGTFTSSFDFPSPAPTGTPGLSYKGVEFVNIDIPSSWYYLSSSAVGSPFIAQYGVNPLGASTTAGPLGKIATTVTSDLSFLQTVSITAANQVSVSVQLHNNTGLAITDVKWGVGFDPDQGGSGKNTTLNTILGQGAGAAVNAYDALYGTGLGVTLANTTSAGAFTIASYINSLSCCTAVDPAVALGAGQLVGFSTLADNSISLAYNIGTILSGDTATIGYSYTFAGPIPEPEIYAMMAAGLGLMGFVARRRKGQVAAA